MPVTAPADRRFRRAHVKPARQRKVLLARIARVARLLAAAVAVAAGIYYGAHAVAQAHTLQVQDIKVRGNQHLAKGEVLAILEGLRGEHILATDLAVWRQRLLGSLYHSSGCPPSENASKIGRQIDDPGDHPNLGQ